MKRRDLLVATGVGVTGLVVGCVRPGKEREQEPAGEEQEITPAEDLMREHGVLNRVLLVYEEGLRRLGSAPQDLPPAVLVSAADIVRRFVEDYHEKLEEDHLFPRFEKAGRLVDLVGTLRAQHAAGRTLTDEIRRLSNEESPRSADQRGALDQALRRFIRMYRPHEAREDTVLFPALREIVSPHELGALGEDFERLEHQLFGEEGFERVVEDVAGLERQLGIYDLAQFTP